MLPALFLSHGAPTLIMDPHSGARRFMERLADGFEKPRAILVVSAHWETQTPLITAHPKPETLHDFYGFPDELYEKSYPAPGAPALAQKIAEQINGAIDENRALDHGSWIPLMLAYPKADIPVLQLSLQSDQPAQYHYEMGQSLQNLRDDGVLIIGSGSTTHNLKRLKWHEDTPEDWAVAFENWLLEKVSDNDHEALLHAKTQAPYYEINHPRDEHWLPFYIALGAGTKGRPIHQGFEHKNLSMTSFRFD